VRQRIVVFPSQLGWIALHVCGEAVRQLVYGGADPQAAFARLDVAALDVAAVGAGNRALVKRLQSYAAGERDDFADVEIDLGAQTEFQRRVIDCCRRVAYGTKQTYGDLAKAAGFPRAARAVGNVMRATPVPLIVPCHRVVAAGAAGRVTSCEAQRMKLRFMESKNRAGIEMKFR
jgi:methylated-DNA-[protein]-cysteine S-methyltransferase